ncbi:MAG: HD domain-containing phosphohydrolase [bacterium]
MSESKSNLILSGYDRLRKSDLVTVAEMADAVFGTFEIKVILDRLIQHVALVMKVDRCSVVLIDKDKRFGYVVSTYEDPQIDHLRIELEKYPEIKEVIKNKQVVCIDDASKDSLMLEVCSQLEEINLFSFMILPLCFEDEILGTLFLRTARGNRPFTDEEKLFCQVAASASSRALANARLYNLVKDNFKNTIISMAKSLEKRDQYTFGHSERVSHYSLKIAGKLGFSEEELSVMRYASLLHDIGKIGIHDSILQKAGPLTNEERREINKHPEYGVEILKPIVGMEKIIPIVLHHHEFYDGRGYPEGLKGEEIERGSRIIAVADTYEAMTADRPYRKAMPQEKAVSIIKECSGTQFDPEMVKIFLDIIK